MSFKLHVDADSWFSHIENKGMVKSKFDKWYLCLLVGLLSKESTSEDINKEAFIQSFIQDYQGQKYQIIGYFLSTIMSDNVIDLDNKNELENETAKYLNADSETRLSSEGHERLNEYAAQGFNIIRNEISDIPRDHYQFALNYCTLINKLI